MTILAIHNSLSKETIPDSTKLKAFADDKMNVAELMVSIFDAKKKTLLDILNPLPDGEI